MNDGVSETRAGDAPDGGFRDRSSAGGKSVLAIERNESTRQLMTRALRSTYRVRAAVSYDQGRRYAEAGRYDAVILSVYHRDLDEGIELLGAIRATEDHTAVPVILVGRPPLGRDEEALRDAGFDDVLRMPFTQSDLLAILDRHVEGG
jgi:DNA-binding response OmpR family regulator